MDWRNRSPEEKVKLLKQQMADIQRAKDLLGHFEQLTQKWLDNLKSKKSLHHGRRNARGQRVDRTHNIRERSIEKGQPAQEKMSMVRATVT